MLSNEFLCDSCSLLVASTTAERNLDTPLKHQPSGSALKLSAQGGCPLCVQLWDHYLYWDWKSDDPTLFEGSSPDSEFTCKWVQPKRCWFEGYRQPDENYEGGIETIAEIWFYPITSSNDSANFSASSNTGSIETMNLASEWFRTCSKTHNCHQTKKSFFPTRVLGLGSMTTPMLRLFIKDEVAPVEPYATLSHCWGKVPLKRLLKATLLSMMEGLVFDELPKTFREAITLTRLLGIQYLWIDSFCIVQDSNEDWEKESAQMEFVYSNAICNIAATAAANSQEGCFIDRVPELAQACRVKIPSFSDKASEHPSADIFDIVTQDWQAQTPMSHSPLNKRAWVAQEQYLSNRIIHCTRTQLYWECRALFASERYPNGIPNLRGGYGSADLEWYTQEDSESFSTESQNTSDSGGDFEDREGVEKWNSIIEDYSGRLLTKEQDKLIAISGLAKDIQPHVHNYKEISKYLAGLWQRFLPEQLLWLAKRFPWVPTNPVRTISYCAPSWSWASLHGAIEHYDPLKKENQQYMIQILEATTTPLTSNLMGQVSGGYICLRGWLKLFSIERDPDGYDLEDWFIVVNGQSVCLIDFDESYPSSVKQHQLFCLPILREPREDDEIHTAVLGLILEPLGKGNQYKRVGMFGSDTDEQWKYFTRPYYPATSETPTDGKASYIDVISELVQGIDVNAGELAESSPKSPAQACETSSTDDSERGKSGEISNRVYGNDSDDHDDYDYDEGWVESIITIV